jgi:hypothetical protein
MDTKEGDTHSPQSLHKYLYASASPVNRIDPSGNDDMVDLAMSMSIDSTLNAAFSSAVLGPNGTTAGAWLANRLIPQDVLSALNQHVTPDAMIIGGDLQVNTPSLGLSASFGDGFEYVTSLGNGEHAWYFDWTLGANWGKTGAGISGSPYFGMIWACPDAASYTGVAMTVSAPLGALTKDGSLVSLLGGISSTMVPTTGFANISWSPGLNRDGLRTFAVTVGATASYTGGGGPTVGWGASYDSYTLLTQDVNFK